MLEVVTHIWCDQHLMMSDQEKVEATTRRLGADDRWYEVELCSGCWEASVTPLLTFLEEFGVQETSGAIPPSVLPPASAPAKVAKRQPAVQEELSYVDTKPVDRLDCWVPGCGLNLRADSMAKHQREHGLDRKVLVAFCPVCAEEFPNHNASNLHARHTHSLRVDQLYKLVLEAGDPEGTVSGRLSLAGWNSK
jgi:hypothetical protein